MCDTFDYLYVPSGNKREKRERERIKMRECVRERKRSDTEHRTPDAKRETQRLFVRTIRTRSTADER